VTHIFERRHQGPADPESNQLFRRTPLWFTKAKRFERTHLVIPAAYKSYHQRLYYRFNIPTRMETIIVSVYWTLNLVLCAMNFEAFYGMSSK
jgi:hypothetical protein